MTAPTNPPSARSTPGSLLKKGSTSRSILSMRSGKPAKPMLPASAMKAGMLSPLIMMMAAFPAGTWSVPDCVG